MEGKCSGCKPKVLTDEGASEAQKTGEEGVRREREEKAQSSGRRAQKR